MRAGHPAIGRSSIAHRLTNYTLVARSRVAHPSFFVVPRFVISLVNGGFLSETLRDHQQHGLKAILNSPR